MTYILFSSPENISRTSGQDASVAAQSGRENCPRCPKKSPRGLGEVSRGKMSDTPLSYYIRNSAFFTKCTSSIGGITNRVRYKQLKSQALVDV